MEEIWKDIPKFEGYYQASNLGRVKSFWKSGRILKQRVNPTTGYVQVSLHKNKKSYHRSTHVLIGLTFLGPRPTGYEINHKDFNKENNFSDNLEYLTPEQNVLSSSKAGKCRKKLTEKDVLEIRANKDTVHCFILAKKFNCSEGNIRHIQTRKCYKWVK